MQHRPSHAAHRVAVRPLAAALALLAASAAFADDEPSPYYLGVVAEYGHDSNVQRLPKPDGKADSFTSLGLLAGLDQPIGRQRVFASARVNSLHYQDISAENHVNYSVSGGLDWSTIERLSGNLNASLNQDVQDRSVADKATTGRVLVKGKAVSFKAQYGLVSLLSLDAVLGHRETDYSTSDLSPADSQKYADSALRQDSFALGVKYRPSGALTLGSGLRLTRGHYPTSGFDRHDIDFTADWRATGQSTVSARLSVGRQTFDGANDGRNWSGGTGALNWAYTPTGKLSFNTQISRDTGAQSGYEVSIFTSPFRPPQTFEGDDSQFTTALTTSATYAATAKIRLTANGRYARRTLVRAPFSGSDASKSLSLTAAYQAARSLLFSCDIARNTRGAPSDTVANGLSWRYASNSASCSAQFIIQ